MSRDVSPDINIIIDLTLLGHILWHSIHQDSDEFVLLITLASCHALSEIVFTQSRHLAIWSTYREVSNIRRTLVGNKIVDHSDVVGASPVGAAPTTSSFST